MKYFGDPLDRDHTAAKKGVGMRAGEQGPGRRGE